MTQTETASVLALLRAAYPSFYRNMNADVMNDVLALWYEMFRGEDGRIVKAALKRLISKHTGYPPDIAAVKQYIEETESAVNGDPTDEDLWEDFRYACTDGIYHARERFDELPELCKRFAVSPNTIRQNALSPEEHLDTTVKTRFFRVMPELRERLRAEKAARGEDRPRLTPAEAEDRCLRLLAALGEYVPAPPLPEGGKGAVR